MAENSLANYDLLEKIGEGGICEIWKIRRHNDDSILALKKLKLTDQENIEALEREYKFLAFHSHPGLPSAYHFIKRDNVVAIVMDYLPGQTLESECGKLSNEKFRARILEVCEIANFVYHCGYIYNDYKPQNFIVSDDGKLNLIDFNLVQRAEDRSNQKSGTFGYLAPELLTGSQASVQSDIYSLGATFYELATGRMPFIAPDEGALVKMITESKPDSPATGDQIIDQIILSMLETDRDERLESFASIAEFLGELESFRESVKNNRRCYLESGLWPMVKDISAQVISSQNEPVLVLAQNEYECERLYENFINMFSIHYEDVIAVDFNESNIHESIANIDRVDSIIVINCSSIFSDDIVGILNSIIEKNTPRADVLLLSSSVKYETCLKVNSISYRNLDNATQIYVKNQLKSYSLSDKILEQLEALTAGDPELVLIYNNHLIDNDAFEIHGHGWEDKSDIEECGLPSVIVEECQGIKDSLTNLQCELINILSLVQRPERFGFLQHMGGSEISVIKEGLSKLDQMGLISLSEDIVSLRGDSRIQAFYNLISDADRLCYHGKAREYYKQVAPDLEQEAYHCFYSGNYSDAINLNYEVAEQYFTQFNIKKARIAIQLAEAAYHELTKDSVVPGLAVRVFNLSGEIAKAMAENNKAIAKYDKAVAIASGIDDQNLLAEVYKNIGDTYRLKQQPEESIDYSLKALAIYEKLNNLPLQAACLNNLGLAYWTGGEYDRALEYFGKSLKVNEELGELTEQSKIYNNIAIIYDISGMREQALNGFNKALECAVSVKNPQLEVKYLDNIGFFYLNSGQPQESLEYFHKSYQLAMEIGFDEGQLNVVSNIAQAYHKMGDFIQSAEANQKALAIAESLNHNKFSLQSSYLIARDCLALGNYRLAGEMLEKAEIVNNRLANPEMKNDLLLLKVSYYVSIGDLKSADDILKSLRGESSLTYNQKVKYQCSQLGMCNLKNDSLSNAKKLFDDILDTDLDEFKALAIIDYGWILFKQDDDQSAQEVLNLYNDINNEDTLIDLNLKILLAYAYCRGKAYDQALSLIADVESISNDKGCLPLLFKAMVYHASILDECGKQSQLMSLLSQIQQVLNGIADNLPDNESVTKAFNNSEFVALKIIADRYEFTLKVNGESLQNEKTA